MVIKNLSSVTSALNLSHPFAMKMHFLLKILIKLLMGEQMGY